MITSGTLYVFVSFFISHSPVFTCIDATAFICIGIFLFFRTVVICDLLARMFHAFFYVCLCAVVISKTMADLTRPLTVRFATRHYARLGHEEILESLEENLEPEDHWSCKRSPDILTLVNNKTYKTWKIYGKEMTLTFNTHISS